MNTGFFLVYRKVWENKLLRDEPFTEREAWLWMIGAANYEPKEAKLGKSLISIKRGQFITSQRKLAQRFKWTRRRVRVFLEKLKKGDEKGAQITAHFTAQSATHITICNYDRYQLLGPTKGPSKGPTSDPQLININEINEIKDREARKARDSQPGYSQFVKFWCDEYKKRFGVPYRYGKAKDGKLVKSLLACFGYDKLCQMAIAFLNSKDEWIKKAGFTIPVFSTQANRIAQQISKGDKNGRSKYDGLEK